jgi:hypothetical protein
VEIGTLIQQLDLLVGSLALDEELKQAFVNNRQDTIRRFNREFAPRFHQRPIMLSNEAWKLVLALNADTWKEFVDLLAIITTAYQTNSTAMLSTGLSRFEAGPVFPD